MVKVILALVSVFVICFSDKWDLSSPENTLEISGVMVTPHFVSGEIPGNDRDEVFTDTYNPGALIKFFVTNRNTSDTLFPVVSFNGRNGTRLLADKVISYGNTPDIRKNSTRLTTYIPPVGSDYYLLNITDSNFYSKGIDITIRDSLSGQSFSKHVDIVRPDFFAERILFTSSAGNKLPDGFNIWFRNRSDDLITLNEIKIHRSGGTPDQHFWNIKPEKLRFKWFGKDGKILPGDISGAYVTTGNLKFGEIIIEVGFSRNSGKERLFYAIKPMVIDFDFGMGWADRYLAGSEAFCKTVAIMHLNTNNGNASGFFSNSERAAKYDIKKFAKLPNVEEESQPGNLQKVHAAEHFGEPQFDKKPAQDIYNYYTTYRHSGYPSTLTLSHEPGFNRYCGVVDFPHFDAYRVTAPHADKWGGYTKYGEKNVRWGAPLETIGDYMRTLHRISAPNPVAAWTQGISDGWSSRLRPGAGNPNDLEMRIQAYEAVANGALSLYWFNISGKNIIRSRRSLAEIQRINREIKVVGSLISGTVPFSWVNRFMDLDLNVLGGPDYAILLAIDLKYKVSPENQFVASGNRTETMEFAVPDYLTTCNSAVKISHDGIKAIPISLVNKKAIIEDTFNTTAFYIIYNKGKQDLFSGLQRAYQSIIAKEESYKFNPITNDNDFKLLENEVTVVDAKK